jgi:hypothetical protein
MTVGIYGICFCLTLFLIPNQHKSCGGFGENGQIAFLAVETIMGKKSRMCWNTEMKNCFWILN